MAIIFQGVVFLVLGVAVAYQGSFMVASQFNWEEVVGPLLFWYAALLLLFRFPLREAASASYRGIRTRVGAAVFWPYLALHLFIYGFLLELILAGIYGMTFNLGPSLSVVTDAFVPPTFSNALLDLSYSPSAIFTLPPVLSGAFSLYSVSAALVIGVLVVANVLGVMELGRLRTAGQRPTSFVVLPAVGVVLGASCCLSLPALIALSFPSAALTETFQLVYSVTYFLLPAFAGAVLYVNLRSVEKITQGLGKEHPDSNREIPGAKV
jgi:hypothetical protein